MRKLTLDGLEEVTGNVEAGVGAVGGLGREPHGSTVAATGLRLGVIGAAGVPGKAEEDGSIAAILVLVVLLDELGDGVVHLLVVLLGVLGVQDRGRAGLVEEVVARATDSSRAAEPEERGRAAGLGGLGGVEAAAALAEGLAGRGDEGAALAAGAESSASELAGGRGHREDLYCGRTD